MTMENDLQRIIEYMENEMQACNHVIKEIRANGTTAEDWYMQHRIEGRYDALAEIVKLLKTLYGSGAN